MNLSLPVSVAFDLFMPRRCAGCDVRLGPRATSGFASAFCSLCAVTCLEPDPGCDVCGLPLASPGVGPSRCGACLARPPLFRRARWAAEYGGAVQSAVTRFKYRGREDALDALMSLGLPPTHDVDAIVPVPLHWLRRVTRGFNQSALLASRIAASSGVPLVCDAMRRVRRTPPQATLDEKGRSENLRGAFRVVRPDRVKGLRVLLVDDVVTTGATTLECAKVLRRAGAASVDLWSVARVI